MSLFKTALSLRRVSNLETRLALREEKFFYRKFLLWLGPVYVLFGIVDAACVPTKSLFYFLALRASVIVACVLAYRFLRGRSKFALRQASFGIPTVWLVQWLMISNHLDLSPYFFGFGLVMVVWTFFFPARAFIFSILMSVAIAPVILHTIVSPYDSLLDNFLVVGMTIGIAIVCVLNAHFVYGELKAKLAAQAILRKDLGSRQKIINAKAQELAKRKTFESQFSPQVVAALLKDPKGIRSMSSRLTTIIVIDIEDSTGRAQQLDPESYRYVVEDVFDCFSSACLKWNITIDKFTGDGAQAFAGAPIAYPDDPLRALSACRDVIRMIKSRQDTLSTKWGTKLNVRFAAVTGDALVGFVGGGAMKSFTAMGETVSFAHRLVGVAVPFTIAYANKHNPFERQPAVSDLTFDHRRVSDLKGFGSQSFDILVGSVAETEPVALDFGRCGDCGTPLLLDDDPSGLPQIICPGCKQRARADAA